jgi:hypothetical protein
VVDEAVNIPEGDPFGWTIPHECGELGQVVLIVPPIVRLRITAAHSVDELVDLG